VLDDLKTKVSPEAFPAMVGRISFFVNAGIRFVTELCKMRAFTELWDEICQLRYGIDDPTYRRFRYGVQVNSLGLTEQQPENNVYRIMIEMLAVTLSKNARARAVQLPAWNEALGLPRPWDQQWSLRMQQIMAYETDLLEYDDLFAGNPVITAKVEALKAEARAELGFLDAMGGAVGAIEYMKSRLVESNAARIAAIESGETTVVGVNRWRMAEQGPLTSSGDCFLQADPNAEAEQLDRLADWTRSRDADAAQAAISTLRRAVQNGDNIMPPSIACAKAAVTTGEWADVMRSVYGQYRAPTGVSTAPSNRTEGLDEIRAQVDQVSQTLGRKLKFLMGKPGLDGHSNGAEQISARARDCGMEFSYAGIRLTPEEIVAAVREEAPHVIGLSILSGSHIPLMTDVMARLRNAGLGHIPVIVGGIIPAGDTARLQDLGIARVYTPKDFELNRIMSDIIALAKTAVPAAA
jgi:ethylmalonyl-CoA mutase